MTYAIADIKSGFTIRTTIDFMPGFIDFFYYLQCPYYGHVIRLKNAPICCCPTLTFDTTRKGPAVGMAARSVHREAYPKAFEASYVAMERLKEVMWANIHLALSAALYVINRRLVFVEDKVKCSFDPRNVDPAVKQFLAPLRPTRHPASGMPTL